MTYGPIDFIAFELQTNQLKGEALSALLDLIENKIVRVVDLVVVMKDQDGNHQALEVEEFAPDLLSIFDPEEAGISGIIQVEDIASITEQLENNTTAAVLVIENLWAIKFGDAVRRANGRMVMHERIPFEVINEAMETFAKIEAEALPRNEG